MNNTAVAVAPEPVAVSIQPPGPELLADAQRWIDVAKSYAITFPEARVAAGADLAACKVKKREVEADKKAILDPLRLAEKRLVDFFRAPLEYLDIAITTLADACNAYDRETERQRQIVIAAAAKLADEQRRKLEDDARKAKAAGNAETAHVLASAAAVVAPAPIAAAPKIAGESYREQWGVDEDTIDLVALARAVADGVIAASNILPNLPVLNQQARALKGALNIPGVKAVSKRVIASRTA